MFQAESTWGKVRPLARNRAHPAATMIKSCADIKASQQASFSLCDPHEFAANVDCKNPQHWAPEQAVLDDAMQCVPLGTGRSSILGEEQQFQLHEMYLARSLGSNVQDARLTLFRQLWEQYIGHLRDLPLAEQRRAGFNVSRSGIQSWATTRQRVSHIVQFATFIKASPSATPDQHALAARMPVSVQCYKSAQIGSLKLVVGSWFLAKPGFLDAGEKSAAAMWFGHVEQILTHIGPSQSSNLIIQVPVWGGNVAGACACTKPINITKYVSLYVVRRR